MFDYVSVVQSAVSAFNNAALVGPAFLWWAVLMLPLFYMVYLYAGDFIKRIGWNRDNLLSQVSVWTVIFIFIWVVLFGGNYAVLRDDLSVLPMLTAVIVFLSALFVSSHVREYPLPHKGWKQWLVVFVVLLFVGMSDMHAWWGPILQISALFLGAVCGRVAGGKMRPMGGCVLVMMTTMMAILMQPEFFRFGQLGNLTVWHLLSVLVFVVSAVGAVVASNVKPLGKIHKSVFVKLKWLGRVLTLLAMSLFVLTEAVPVYAGVMVICAAMFVLSVIHATNPLYGLGNKLFAISLISFGIITVMPVICAMGLIFWKVVSKDTSKVDFWNDFKVLL